MVDSASPGRRCRARICGALHADAAARSVFEQDLHLFSILTMRRGRRRRMQHRARAIVLGTIFAAFALQAALLASFSFWPLLRDPDYGNRIVRLETLVGEHPNRPLL